MPVDTVHLDHLQSQSTWSVCRDVLGGQDAIKAQGTKYLPKLGGQSAADYAAYLARAVFYAGTARARDAMTGAVFSKDATVQVPEDVRARIENLLEDVTLSGVPLNDFGLQILNEVISVGRAGILVDVQADDAPDRARRPYFVAFGAEQVINWRVARINGDYVTALVVLKGCVEDSQADEFTSAVREEFRVLRLQPVNGQLVYTVEVFHREGNELKSSGPIMPTRRGQPLGFIPFVVVNPTSIKWDIEKPPLYDMALLNLAHYQTETDLRHALHAIGLPTPWGVGLPTNMTEVPLGPTSFLKLEGENAQCGLLEFKGEGLKEIRQELAHLEELMAVLGARLIERAQAKAETAESVRARNAAAFATLKTIASTTSLALTNALRWAVWWAGHVDAPLDRAVSVTLNQEFIEPTVTADEIKTLVLAYQAGAISFDTFVWNLKKAGRARPGVTPDEERELINADALTGRAELDADAVVN